MHRVCLILACLPVAAAGCISVQGQQPNLLTTEQEIALGEKFAQEVEDEKKVLDDPVIQEYVNTIGAHLARYSPRTDVEYRFTVIDEPEEVNAFALPGGHLYFYTGLMKLCENEAQLAAVMAHEMAHVAEHHHGENLTRRYGMEFLANMLLGEEPGEFAQLASQLLGTGLLMNYSRQNEREADQLGMRMLYQGGYDPEGMVAFMNRMLEYERSKGGGHPLPIFSSHPPTQERMNYLNLLAQQYAPGYDVVNADVYRTKVLDRLAD